MTPYALRVDWSGIPGNPAQRAGPTARSAIAMKAASIARGTPVWDIERWFCERNWDG